MPVVFDGIFNPQEPEIYYHMYSVANIIILLHKDVVDDMMYQTLFTHMLMLMLIKHKTHLEIDVFCCIIFYVASWSLLNCFIFKNIKLQIPSDSVFDVFNCIWGRDRSFTA